MHPDSVDETNNIIGGHRIRFADPQIAPWNAVFGSSPRLFGLDPLLGEDPLPRVSQQDPMADERIAACAAADDCPEPLDFDHRMICERASVGHPNIRGAQKYADAIFAAIIDTPSLLWVDFSVPCLACGDGTLENPYNSLWAGVNASAEGGMINIASGSTSETITITKNCRLQSCGGVVTIGKP